MNAMLAAFVATVVIAIGASATLNQAGFSAQEQAANTAVRLD